MADATQELGQTHRSEWLVEETDLDFYGHLNNLAAFRLFERARWQMITEGGYGYDVIASSQLGPVLLGMDIEFRKEVRNRERVIIETRAVRTEGRVGEVLQTMTKPSGELACTLRCRIGLFDLRARKLVPPTDAWRIACGLALPGRA